MNVTPSSEVSQPLHIVRLCRQGELSLTTSSKGPTIGWLWLLHRKNRFGSLNVCTVPSHCRGLWPSVC